MTFTEVVDAPPRKPITELLKPATDRVTREKAEHPKPPKDPVPHPVTRTRAPGRERIGG